MPRALLSVSDKSGLAGFARGLAARGFELVSTGGTARALEDAGLPVVAVSTVTGFPELMDGRVKTLHPMIHGGILARRSRPDDLAAAAAHGITPIDLVVVNLYPFARVAAAKNFQDVLVVVSPADYDAVLHELDRDGGPSREFRLDLSRRAFAHTAGYDRAIAATLDGVSASASGFARATPAGSPQRLTLELIKRGDLRYGENPHQQAAWYAEDPPYGLGAAALLQGKELSYTNLLDLDAAARIVLEFDEPAAALIKHTNPCGAAIGATAAEAYVRAREADALSAFGAVIAVNRPIDIDTARAIASTRIDAVIAPEVAADARPILAAKGAMRVVTVDFGLLAKATGDLRSILGAVLVQER